MTIGVLVHKAGDKVGGDSDDKSLGDRITSTEGWCEWVVPGRHRGHVTEGLSTLGQQGLTWKHLWYTQARVPKFIGPQFWTEEMTSSVCLELGLALLLAEPKQSSRYSEKVPCNDESGPGRLGKGAGGCVHLP